MEAPGIRRSLVHLQTALTALGINARATAYEHIAAGLITKPIRIGRQAALPSDEINALVDARVAGLPKDEIKKLVDQLHAKRAVGYTVIGA